MKNSMSRILIETVVKKTIKELKQDPERSIRNLVDMALHFSDGRFQKHFFEIAQKMLQNESSSYYALLQDFLSYADEEHLLCFGMNLGYNSCTYGAKRIRNYEKQLNFNIPWMISLQLNTDSLSHLSRYQTVITEGENLGIYSWLLSANFVAADVFPLITSHPDSAFFLFCAQEDITEEFLQNATDAKNVMLVILYHEDAEDTCIRIREMGIPYSVYYPYSEKDLEIICNGDLFYSAQQLHPAFTILVPQPGLNGTAQQTAYQAAIQARNAQVYRTFPVELYGDSQMIDQIISDDSCSVTFDSDGNLWNFYETKKKSSGNIFRNNLHDILKFNYYKESFSSASR